MHLPFEGLVDGFSTLNDTADETESDAFDISILLAIIINMTPEHTSNAIETVVIFALDEDGLCSFVILEVDSDPSILLIITFAVRGNNNESVMGN